MSAAEIAPLPEGYGIRPYHAADAETVRALWAATESVAPDVAARRVHETWVLLTDPAGAIAGTGSAHLRHEPRLRMAMWSPEVFVAPAHRRGLGARRLMIELRDVLAARWESGEDRRGQGVLVEVQSQALRGRRDAVWKSKTAFIGQSEAGHHLRAFYFAGAEVPVPSRARTRARVRTPAGPPRAHSGPVFVVAAPGAGAGPLAAALAESPQLTPVDGDSALASLPTLDPAERDWASQRLGAGDVTEGAGEAADAALGVDEGRALVSGHTLGLRVPFLMAACPGATFVFLHREPEEALPVAVAAWEAGAHGGPTPPGWDREGWEFALTPNWRGLRGRSLAEVAAGQWEAVTRVAVGDLQRLPVDRWAVADHAVVRRDPRGELARLASFLGVELEPPGELPEAPAADPAVSRDELLAALDRTADTASVARGLFAASTPAAPSAPSGPRPAEVSDGLADLLNQLQVSLVIASPDAGAVLLGRRSGGDVNLHSLAFDRPSALAARDGLLAVATRAGVTEFRDIPGARDRVGGPIAHDACFVPGRTSHTGWLDIQDLGYDDHGHPWLASARFSCLATLDDQHSFVPRWVPPFVGDLAAEDRCHLNGVAVDGEIPRFVTALAPTATAHGWRDAGVDSGVLVDVTSGETALAGLRRPASPRFHDGRLWALAGEDGALLVIDPERGTTETVAEVGGWARGLAFADHYAFVGTSRHRDGRESRGGVTAIDLHTGQAVATLHLDDGARDVAAVIALPGVRYPAVVDAQSDAALNAFLLP